MIPKAAPLSARQLRRLLDPLILSSVEAACADRYRKRFPAFAHVWMLLLHVCSANMSLRQSHASQSADPRLRRRLGMPDWISYSQLARSSTSRPLQLFEELFARVLREAKARPSGDPTWGLLRHAAALDATTFSLSLKLSPWCRYKRHKPEVRVQTLLDLARAIPDTLHLTLADRNDRRELSEWELSQLWGWTLIFDLGYYAHRHFSRLLEAGVSLITPLCPQAYYEVTHRLLVPDERTLQRDRVLADELINLGSPKNRGGAVLKGMRLVTYKTQGGKLCRVLTDRRDLSAVEVVRLYRARWRIELFFRWLKRQLGAIAPLGHSRQALWLTILLAAIVAVLAWLVDGERPRGTSRISWLRALASALIPSLQPSG